MQGQLLLLILVTGSLLLVSCTTSGPSRDIPALNISKTLLSINGQALILWAIPTGTIQIKDCHFENCLDDDRSYIPRFLSILLSRTPAPEKLPIFTYLIQHPQGTFLIDAGGDVNWSNDDSWSCDSGAKFVSRRIADVDVKPEQSLPQRLEQIGVSKEKIDAVVITHLHFDHTASLPELGVKTYVGQGDLDAGDKIGSVPCKFFRGVETIAVESLLAVRPIRKEDQAEQLFGPSLSLTPDQSLRIFSTPGHTPGSLVVQLMTDQGHIWFIGDISFSDQAMLPTSKVAGMHFDIPQVRELHRKFSTLATQDRVLLVPSHDKAIQYKIRSFHQ